MKNDKTQRRIEGSDDFIDAFKELCDNSQQELAFLFDELDALVFNDADLVNIISELLRKHPKAHLRMMLKRCRNIASRRNLLLDLAKRLPSKIVIRQLSIPPQNDSINYAVGDRSNLLLNRDIENYQGYLRIGAKAEAQNLLEEFNDLWERQSRDIPDIQQFRL